MPRTEIDLPRTAERLSILDEHGVLDEDLLSHLPITHRLSVHPTADRENTHIDHSR